MSGEISNLRDQVQMTESREGMHSVLRDVVKEIKQQGKQRRGMT